MAFSYANPTSGPSAGGIGWFDFGNLTINPNQTITGLSGTLNDGSTVSFDLTLTTVSGTPRSYASSTVPTFANSQFGTAGYTGISGKVALYSALALNQTVTSAIAISNIAVVDVDNNPVSNYSVLIADAERTNLFESIGGLTDGGNWSLFTTVGTGSIPTLTGIGTQSFNSVGVSPFGQTVAYVFETQAPGQINLTIDQLNTTLTRQGFCIGFAVTRIALNKYVGARIDAADQFVLNIDGVPSDQSTTSGNTTGFQAQSAQIFASANAPYTISEAMAPGSVSLLSDYTRVVIASNATPAGSVPPTGNMPINFIPALGDDVTYTIFNAIPQVFIKTVDKSYADIGEVLTYTVTIDNPNDVAVSNVLFTDPTPIGTTYIGNLLVSVPYVGIDPNSGLTITTIGAKESAIISWQVRIGTAPSTPTPIVNLADVVVPGGSSGMTNVVTTAIRTAYISIGKTVDKTSAKPGDVLTYTLFLSNVGNVAAYNVVLSDPLPKGTTFVAGSLVGATGILPTLTLNAPLAAGGMAAVTYQVKIDNVIPAINPISNSSSLIYSYTVDPAKPLGTTKVTQSNIVTTLVNEAKLSIVKTTDKIMSYIGDTITYQLSIKNIGNVPANNVILTDTLTIGTVYIPGTLAASVPTSGDPTTNIVFVNPIAAGQTVSVMFKVKVVAIPNPNPILNFATAAFTYTIDSQNPDGAVGEGESNVVRIPVMRYNFGQSTNDVIHSVAWEQAALAAIINAEGAKVQRMAAIPGVSSDELLCLNSSVGDMMNSMSMLEAVLKQKINVLACQIDGETC